MEIYFGILKAELNPKTCASCALVVAIVDCHQVWQKLTVVWQKRSNKRSFLGRFCLAESFLVFNFGGNAT
jgi:hypothetical protein